jgi:hypothetical protein
MSHPEIEEDHSAIAHARGRSVVPVEQEGGGQRREMQRIQAEESPDQKGSRCRRRLIAFGVDRRDHEAGQDKEQIDEQSAVTKERHESQDRSGAERQMMQHHKKRRDAAQRFEIRMERSRFGLDRSFLRGPLHTKDPFPSS